MRAHAGTVSHRPLKYTLLITFNQIYGRKKLSSSLLLGDREPHGTQTQISLPSPTQIHITVNQMYGRKKLHNLLLSLGWYGVSEELAENVNHATL